MIHESSKYKTVIRQAIL